MGLTNQEKDELGREVKRLIALGYGEKGVIAILLKRGSSYRNGLWKRATIQNYYRAFKEVAK